MRFWRHVDSGARSRVLASGFSEHLATTSSVFAHQRAREIPNTLRRMEIVPRFVHAEDTESVKAICRDLVPEVEAQITQFGEPMVEEIAGGITNKLYRVSVGDIRVLTRIYGNFTEHLIDREAEMTNFLLLSEASFAPRFYGRFRNGFVYGFIEGKTLTPIDLHQGTYTDVILRKMAKFNAFVPGSVDPTAFAKERSFSFSYFDKVKQIVIDEYQRRSTPSEEMPWDVMESLSASMRSAEEALGGHFAGRLFFSHNDLLAGNVIYQDQLKDVMFIDYEYCGWNPFGYDLGNHIVEYAGLQLDPKDVPCASTICSLIRDYVKHYREADPDLAAQCSSSDMINRLHHDMKYHCITASGLWAIWSYFQHLNSEIDFDYLSYAQKRIELIVQFEHSFPQLSE